MSRTAYCFDLDGTLTSTEILPCIAAEIGISEEMATLTRITMEGLITFEESIRLRVAIVGRVPIKTVHSIVNEIELNPQMVEFIQQHINQSFIVTGNLDIWINPIINRLGCRRYTSLASIKNGIATLQLILNKANAIKDIRDQGFDRVISIGDGSNDIPMFKASDIAIAFGGIHSPTNGAINNSNFVVHDGATLCNLLSTL